MILHDGCYAEVEECPNIIRIKRKTRNCKGTELFVQGVCETNCSYHSKDTPSANPTMMAPWRFVVGATLAFPWLHNLSSKWGTVSLGNLTLQSEETSEKVVSCKLPTKKLDVCLCHQMLIFYTDPLINYQIVARHFVQIRE